MIYNNKEKTKMSKLLCDKEQLNQKIPFYSPEIALILTLPNSILTVSVSQDH